LNAEIAEIAEIAEDRIVLSKSVSAASAASALIVERLRKGSNLKSEV
jgi:hypothetical protein